jgi:hypothetical protein
VLIGLMIVKEINSPLTLSKALNKRATEDKVKG